MRGVCSAHQGTSSLSEERGDRRRVPNAALMCLGGAGAVTQHHLGSARVRIVRVLLELLPTEAPLCC